MCVVVVVATVRRGRVVSPLCRQGMTGRLERLSGLLIKGGVLNTRKLFISQIKASEGSTDPSLSRYMEAGSHTQVLVAHTRRVEGGARHRYECVHAGVRGPQGLMLMPARSASRDYN